MLNPFLLFAKMYLLRFSSQQAKKMADVFTRSGKPLLDISQKGFSYPRGMIIFILPRMVALQQKQN